MSRYAMLLAAHPSCVIIIADFDKTNDDKSLMQRLAKAGFR